MDMHPAIARSDEIVSNQKADVGYDFVDLQSFKPDEAVLDLAPGEFALRNQVLPLAMEEQTLLVAIGSPDSLTAVDDLGILLHMHVRAVLADPALIRERIEEFFLEKILA